MSGLRTRTAIVATVAAIALPMGIVFAGSASAAGLPIVPADVPVVSSLLGSSGNSISLPLIGDSGSPLGAVTGALAGTPAAGVLDTATGLLGGAGAGDVMGTATGLAGGAGAGDVVGTVTGLVGGAGAGGLVPGGLGELPVLEDTLETVTDTVDTTLETVTDTVEDTLETVTDTLEAVTGIVDGVLNTDVATSTKSSKSVKVVKAEKPATVAAEGALPHTGGNANATAMLLCAGLAVAGAGVTLVTRRRNGLGS